MFPARSACNLKMHDLKVLEEARMSKDPKDKKDSGSGLCCPYCSLSKYPCANMERIEKEREKEKKQKKGKT